MIDANLDPNGTDYVQKMIDRLKREDPSYGSQKHQVDFVERCYEMQRLEPCARHHPDDEFVVIQGVNFPTYGEHILIGRTPCYSQATRDAVVVWQKKMQEVSSAR